MCLSNVHIASQQPTLTPTRGPVPFLSPHRDSCSTAFLAFKHLITSPKILPAISPCPSLSRTLPQPDFCTYYYLRAPLNSQPLYLCPCYSFYPECPPLPLPKETPPLSCTFSGGPWSQRYNHAMRECESLHLTKAAAPSIISMRNGYNATQSTWPYSPSHTRPRVTSSIDYFNDSITSNCVSPICSSPITNAETQHASPFWQQRIKYKCYKRKYIL